MRSDADERAFAWVLHAVHGSQGIGSVGCAKPRKPAVSVADTEAACKVRDFLCVRMLKDGNQPRERLVSRALLGPGLLRQALHAPLCSLCAAHPPIRFKVYA